MLQTRMENQRSRRTADYILRSCRRPGNDAWRSPDAIVRHGRGHRHKLQGRHSDFLAHRDRTNAHLRPAAHRLGHAASLARKLNPSSGTKAEIANVLIHAIVAQTERDLDSPYVTRILQNLADREHPICLVVVNRAATEEDFAHLAIEDFVG